MKKTFEKFVCEASNRIHDNDKQQSQLRKGQIWYNTLVEFRPTMARKINGTDLDPFYFDSRIQDFLHYVMENWNKAWVLE